MRFSGNLHRRIPLTVKMVVMTIVIGALVGFLANKSTTSSVRSMFEHYIYQMLEYSALENRIRFDNYLNDFRQLAFLFAAHDKLIAHLAELPPVSGPGKFTRYETHPAWFPGKSLMRSLVSPRFVMIYSKDYALREIYYAAHEKNVPQQFFGSDPLTIEKSIGVTHITSFDGMPFIISAIEAHSASGNPMYLVFASPIDELLFLQVRGNFSPQLSGLLTGNKSRILTSSDTAQIPPGALIADISKEFLVHYHQFHEYGGAELQIHFASFTPRFEVNMLTDQFMDKSKIFSIILMLSIVTASSLLMYAFTLRIERITKRVRNFSLAVFDGLELQPGGAERYGDEITLLDASFTRLIHEVERKTNQLQAANDKLRTSIDELVETREELLKAEKMAVVGQMSGIVAHELLNPITSIAIRIEKNIKYGRQALGVTDKLRAVAGDVASTAGPADGSEGRESLDKRIAELSAIAEALAKNQELRLEDLLFLDNELNKVVSIIDNFRQMARKERVVEDINLVDVITDVLDENEDKLRKKDIRLDVDVQPIPLIKGDFMELYSIAANLVSNAIQAMDSREGRGEKLLGITMRNHGTTGVEILVRDTGTGIAPENLGRIFDASFTTKGREGTGFGLSIARKIARSYNGDLTVEENSLGQGAAFKAVLENPQTNMEQGNHAG